MILGGPEMLSPMWHFPEVVRTLYRRIARFLQGQMVRGGYDRRHATFQQLVDEVFCGTTAEEDKA